LNLIHTFTNQSLIMNRLHFYTSKKRANMCRRRENFSFGMNVADACCQAEQLCIS